MPACNAVWMRGEDQILFCFGTPRARAPGAVLSAAQTTTKIFNPPKDKMQGAS
jgi:hypothetical protein